MTKSTKYSENGRLHYRAQNTANSEYLDFTLRTSGHEFYDRQTGNTVEKWLIHNTFSGGDIKRIIHNSHPRYGYRKK